MAELTDAEKYGRGIEFGGRWDFNIRSGSMNLIEGQMVLARDLAFATAIELGDELNQRLTPNLAEDIKAALRRVASNDDRVVEVVDPIEVLKTDDAATAEVQLEVIARDGERGEFIFDL